MFLPRTSSSASITSYASLRTTDSRRGPILPGSSIGWSAPTIASNSINASAQVHYSYLSSVLQDQSEEHGLGIASGRWISSESTVEEQQRSSSGSKHPLLVSGSGSGSHEPRRQSSRAALRDLFAGASTNAAQVRPSRGQHARLAKPEVSGTTALQQESASATSTATRNGRSGVSLRSYAKRRIMATEALEELVFSTTDIGRLKWEAKVSVSSA